MTFEGRSLTGEPDADLGEVMKRRALAAERLLIEHPEDKAGFLAALRSYMSAVGEVEPRKHSVDDRRLAAATCEVILGLCNELAGGTGPSSEELSAAVDDAVRFLTCARLEDEEEVARRLLGRFEDWIAQDPAAKVPVFAKGIGDLLGQIIHGDHKAEALPRSQRLLFHLEPFLHRDPPELLAVAAEAHVRHANLLGHLSSPSATHHSDRAVALAEKTPDAERLLNAVTAHFAHLDANGDKEAAAAAVRLVAVSEQIGGLAPLLSVRRCLDALDEAVGTGALIRAVSAARTELASDHHRRTLADALNRLVARLHAVGEDEEALTYSDRALELWAQLFGNPLRPHEPWADALTYRVAALTSLDRYVEALEPSAQAVEWYGLLCDADPDMRSALARALFNRQLCLTQVGDFEAAAVCTRRLIMLYTGLAKTQPGRLAEAYGLHGRALTGLHRHDEALAMVRESVARYERLSARDADRYKADLADAVTDLVIAMQRAGLPSPERLRVSARVVALEEELADPERLRERAHAWRNHSIGLQDAGLRKESAEASARAVDVAGKLGRSPKDLELFADCLDQHALRLRHLGRTEEALEHSAKAVATYEDLVRLNRERFLLNAGKAMDNHAGNFRALKRYEESVEASRKAVAMLAEGGAESLAVNAFGGALGNLANALVHAGRAEEALAVSERTLGVREAFAKTDPAAREGLALALTQRAWVLNANGRTAEAVAYDERAIPLLEELTAEDGSQYRAHLALSLHHYTAYLRDLGRYADSATAARRAVEVAEELAAAGVPDAREDLVHALRHSVEVHMEAGMRTEAGRFLRRAVELARELSEEDGDAYTSLLFDVLSDGGWVWHDADPQAALAATTEHLALAEELFAPERDHYDLAFALDVHGCALGRLGRYTEAVMFSASAIPHWEAAGKDADLALGLSYHAEWLVETGAAAEAVEASTRAIALYRPLYAADPDVSADLAESLRRHAHVLHVSGHDPRAAIAAAKEAVELHEALAADRPPAHLPELARSLITAARVGAGDPAELFARAAAAYERLEADDPGVHTTLAAEAAAEARAKGWS